MTVALDTGSDYAFTLGERTDRSGNHAFSGAIDEVYVYSSALDAASIQVLYDAVTPQPTVTPLPTHVSHSTLVAHYRFDKVSATEDGDSSLDGRIHGAAATTGLFGSYALSFDGTDDYVEFPSAVTADIQGSSSRTICLWAVIDSFSTDGGLFDYGTSSDLQNFALRVDGTDGSLRVQLWGVDTDVALSGSDDGGWHHYCVTYDGSAWYLYFDGSQAATGTDAVNTGSDRALRLGQWNNEGYLDGAIDEVYVYSSALDAASIQVLYDAVTAAPTVTPLPTHVSHSTLVAHYRFDKVLATEDGDRSLPFLVRLSPTRATVRVLFVRAPPARVAY